MGSFFLLQRLFKRGKKAQVIVTKLMWVEREGGALLLLNGTGHIYFLQSRLLGSAFSIYLTVVFRFDVLRLVFSHCFVFCVGVFLVHHVAAFLLQSTMCVPAYNCGAYAVCLGTKNQPIHLISFAFLLLSGF